MGFWKQLFGSDDKSATDGKQGEAERRFDLLKYDGVKAIRLNQADYAVKCFREALKQKDDLETRDYLSQTLISLARFDEALDELAVIRTQHPELHAVYARMGQVAYMMEDYERLSTIADDALQADEGNAWAYYMKAQAANGQGRAEEAVGLLTRSLELDAEQVAVRLLRGNTLLALGKPADAAADADWLAGHTPEQEDALLLVARTRAAQGQVAEALAAYDAVTEQNPFNADAYRERAQLNAGQGNTAAAEADLAHLRELLPDDSSTEVLGADELMKRAYTPINPFGI